MVDKNFCMSSYLALRYIEDDNRDFYATTKHKTVYPVADGEKTFVYSAKEIDEAIQKQLELLKGKNCGLMLSGGMDSANLAHYMRGGHAYTFRFLGGKFQEEELARAQRYASYYDMNLHYVDIDWSTVEAHVDAVMEAKGAPVHSIEPQILQAAMQAKEDGVEVMITGALSDLIFGGMDQLMAGEWTFDTFMKRYMFTQPEEILVEPVDMQYVFERYRQNEDAIDHLEFMRHVSRTELISSYANAFNVAGLTHVDPYAKLELADALDIERIRNGEPKYLIRELFAMHYPDIPIPSKLPMPRPVDHYFAQWGGPTRQEFRRNIDMKKYTGNQKWQMWCLERFLNNHEAFLGEN